MNLSLLDTDTLSEVLKRRNQVVLANARTYLSHYQQFAFSAITRYEVRRGYLSRRAAARLHRFDVFCQHSIVYPISDDVLDQAALLWTDARTRGQRRRPDHRGHRVAARPHTRDWQHGTFQMDSRTESGRLARSLHPLTSVASASSVAAGEIGAQN